MLTLNGQGGMAEKILSHPPPHGRYENMLPSLVARGKGWGWGSFQMA